MAPAQQQSAQAFDDISLDDKYALDTTRAYITGIEALVRLPMLQHQRDLQAGLNTAGFISGYRGSPLGGVDQALWQAQSYLEKHNIQFQPGVNEDLAATAVWGSQQVGLFPGAMYDGVFSMWYGKGPGVDRSMDAIKHANAFGTAKYGGVLAVAGDDHACKSSTLPHQSEHMFIGASVPVLNPANVQEVLDLGIYGWELSRFSGCWVALKAITENMDSAISAHIDPNRVQIIIPDDFELPPEGLNARWPVKPLEQERILNKYRIYAARHFARVNKLNKIVIDSPNPRLGIITSGKSYLDVMQALDDLGIDDQQAARMGLRVYKVGMSWPLEPVTTHEFAKGLEEILVVEEKRSIIEDQLTGQLYNWPVNERPRVIGEFDEEHNDLLPNLGELTPAQIARVIAGRITRLFNDKGTKQEFDSDVIHKRLEFLEAKERSLSKPRKVLERLPHYCSGCPHNISTKVPEGSMAMAGIGCHYMAQWMNRSTETYTHMGGEGCSWIGQAPFTETQHVFQNLGDGTYFHSGLLAIRATIAAKVNITYKILYNHAVAMTGGQAVDGTLSVDQMVYQLRGEGIKRIAVVSNEPEKYGADFPKFDGLTIDHRDRLTAIQLEMRKTPGTTVIIYDQTCATEKRRQLKQQKNAPIPDRVMINSAVCEGCGDCSKASNCLSVLPLETELGRKRTIDQNACNHDYSCLNGFCPSFVTVEGARLKKASAENADIVLPELPHPPLASIDKPWNVLVTGIGGTGVLTVGSVLAMAAHLEGKGCSTLNQTGLAQKFGSVISHVRIGKEQESIHSVRIPAGDADLLLGCDLVVAASDDALAKLHNERSHVIANDYQSVTSDFVQNPDYVFPAHDMKAALQSEAGIEKTHFIDATTIAKNLLGDTIASNLFLLGYAYQKGLVPVSAAAIERAIELNNVAVDMNKGAFNWGRAAVVSPKSVQAFVISQQATPLSQSLDEIIDRRVKLLKNYQNSDYAQSYLDVINGIRQREQKLLGNTVELPFTEAVARNLAKLMAYKDEYEVARLYTDGQFKQQLQQQFTGNYSLRFHLAPPVLSKRDPVTGHLKKRSFGPWILSAFALLAKLKFLRGTAFDPFSYSHERKLEQQLMQDYRKALAVTAKKFNIANHNKAVEIASLPEKVRGFGHVKEKAISQFNSDLRNLLNQLDHAPEQVVHIMERVA
jgi:indolepyruvate ferredoxin oxidoreductase